MLSRITYTKTGKDWIENTNDSREWDENMCYQYHYVAYAIPGLTFAANYFLKCKVPGNYKELFYEINSKNETGTLYPFCKATFMPVPSANYYLGTVEHRKTVTEKEIRNYYKDVLKANNMMGTDTIVLDLRDLDLFLSALMNTSICLEEFKKDSLIKSVIVLSEISTSH